MDTEDRIVDWAPYGQHIPLRCKICGARFHTKNIAPIGTRTVFPDGDECECGHKTGDLEPVRKLTQFQQRVYDAIMTGKNIVIDWPVGAGKTYLYNIIKEDIEAIRTAAREHFKGEGDI